MSLIRVSPMPFCDLVLYPGDIILTAGTSWLGKAVRFFTRGRGESASRVNHSALVTFGGYLRDATIIEASLIVRERPLWSTWGGRKDEVSVWRNRRLTTAQRITLAVTAQRYSGMPYGGWKLLAHAADWAIGGAYIFRRLTNLSASPICSQLIANAYASIRVLFGHSPASISPDDIEDFMMLHPEDWYCVLPLQRLKEEEWQKRVQ